MPLYNYSLNVLKKASPKAGLFDTTKVLPYAQSPSINTAVSGCLFLLGMEYLPAKARDTLTDIVARRLPRQ